MTLEFYPSVGQTVTFIAVKSGKVNVCPGKVLERSEGELELALEETVKVDVGALVSVNYTLGMHQWRAKAVLEALEGKDIRMKLRGTPSRGESRDFIRAQLDMRTSLHLLRATEFESAAEEFSRIEPPGDWSAIGKESVNLSGNGVACTTPLNVSRGGYVGAHLCLASNSGERTFSAVGKAVRVKGAGDSKEVALHFEGISEAEQDQLFDYVSTWYHARIHLALANLSS